MAYDLVGRGSYGSGSLGDVTDPSEPVINAYAAVFNIINSNNSFEIQNVFAYDDTALVKWDNCVGCQVMLHAVYTVGGYAPEPGKYFIATITECEELPGGKKFKMDKSLAEVSGNPSAFAWQAILIPEFKNLTLQNKSLKPLNFQINAYKYGSVLVFKCSDTLTLAGGHIDLRDAGFPPTLSNLDTYRPLLEHESTGTLDTDLYSGTENTAAKDYLIINAGDGVCLIMAKTIRTTSGSSRIGNPATNGVQYCRGASDSDNTPAGVQNVGGSTIAIVTHTWSTFTPNVIAKYRSGSAGRGLARAYIAVLNAHNYIKPDEGLYALDVIHRNDRLKTMCNITGFGKGTDGSYSITSSNASKCWNSYAKVTAISGRVYTISRVWADKSEITDFEVGRLVMIHQSRKASAQDWEDGRFFMSRITAISGSTVTIKHNFSFNLSNYYVQMIVVPEYNNLTVSKAYNNALAWENGAGGIMAICVAGNCDLSGGTFNLESKGTKGRVVNPINSNYSMKGALPLGQGNGSLLIIAKNLTMNSQTRLGATYSGGEYGGRGASKDKSGWMAGGGWRGNLSQVGNTVAKTGGWGGGAGVHPDYSHHNGGWFSNAAGIPDNSYDGRTRSGCQGAHILIIADKIKGLHLNALSTGGAEGLQDDPYGCKPGGCGYGGGGMCGGGGYASAGGYRGGGAGTNFKAYMDSQPYGGGGASGACFVYCNECQSQGLSGVVW